MIQVHRDGRIESDLRDVPDSLSSFGTTPPAGFPVIPGEQEGSDVPHA